MSKQVKAEARQKTPREEANMLAARYAEIYARKQELEKERKEIEEQLHEWAVDHPAEFGEHKTLTLDDAELRWVARSSVNIPGDVEKKDLVRAFPNHAKVDIPVAKARQLQDDPKLSKKLEELGIDVTAEDKFQVKV